MRGARAGRPATGHLASPPVHCSVRGNRGRLTDRPTQTDKEARQLNAVWPSVATGSWNRKDSNGKTGDKKPGNLVSSNISRSAS